MKSIGKTSWRVIVGIVVCTVASSLWFGWYATSVGLAVLSAWFGIVLWKITELDGKILLLILAEVFLVWLAFSLAFFELTANFGIAFSLSMQNLLHFNFINLPDSISTSLLYRVFSAIEGLIGYLLVVSGVAQLITKKVEASV